MVQVAFHQGLHCLLRQNKFSENEMQYYFEIATCDTLIYTMHNPKYIVSNQKEESIIQSVKLCNSRHIPSLSCILLSFTLLFLDFT